MNPTLQEFEEQLEDAFTKGLSAQCAALSVCKGRNEILLAWLKETGNIGLLIEIFDLMAAYPISFSDPCFAEEGIVRSTSTDSELAFAATQFIAALGLPEGLEIIKRQLKENFELKCLLFPLLNAYDESHPTEVFGIMRNALDKGDAGDRLHAYQALCRIQSEEARKYAAEFRSKTTDPDILRLPITSPRL